jgi:hypothetical protein
LGTPVTLNGSATADDSSREIGEDVQGRLCTAMYLDSELRDFVLREIYNARFRWLAPSYGFDAVPVLRYAWRAWRTEVLETTCIVLILGAGVVLQPFATFLATMGLIVWWMLWRLILVCREGAKLLRLQLGVGPADEADEQSARDYRDREVRFKDRLRIHVRATALSLTVLLVMLAFAVRRDLETVTWQVGSLTGVLAVLVMGFAADRQIVLNGLSKSRGLESAPTGGRLAVIARQQSHPAALYSGSKPFIGSGIEIRQWSFVQRLLKATEFGEEPEEEFDSRPFDTKEMVNFLEGEIRDLRSEQDEEMRLPGISVKHQVFLEGMHSQQYVDLLEASDQGEALVERTLSTPGGPARHYLACQVLSWGGEVVTQVFVHASLQGRTLYLEFATQALSPTADPYHVIDMVGGAGKRAVMHASWTALRTLPSRLAVLSRLTNAAPMSWGALLARRSPEPPLRGRADIGAKESVRERACRQDEDEDWPRRLRPDDELDNYFQNADVYKHMKIIERRLLASIEIFLKENKVNIGEFKERATTILNSGIVNIGSGTVNADGAAFGDQSTVHN